MRWFRAACLFAMLAHPAWAQDTEPTSDSVMNDEGVLRTAENVVVSAVLDDARTTDATDKKFWAVGSVLGAAMLLDTHSTFAVIRRCDHCYEANPFAAPFVNRGPVVAVAAGIAFDVGIMALSAKMKRSAHPAARRFWWVMPVAIASAHVVAYRHNLGVR